MRYLLSTSLITSVLPAKILLILVLSSVTAMAESEQELQSLEKYAVAVNQSLGPEIPPEDNFWEGLWPLLSDDFEGVSEVRPLLAGPLHLGSGDFNRLKFDLNFLPKDATNPITRERLDQFTKFTTSRWSPQDAPLLVDWVQRNGPALDQLRNVANRSGSWRPAVPEDSLLILDTRPDSQATRWISSLYLLRVSLKLHEGNTEEALQDLLTVYKIAHHVGNSGFPVDLLRFASLKRQANLVAAFWMMDPGVTAEQRDRLVKITSVLKSPYTVAFVIDHYDRLMMQQLVELMATPGPLRRNVIDRLFQEMRTDPAWKMLLLASLPFEGSLSFDVPTAIAAMNEASDRLTAQAKMSYSRERSEAERKLRDDYHREGGDLSLLFLISTPEQRAIQVTDLL